MMTVIGQKIERLRKENGLSKRAFEDRLGVSGSSVHRWEKGLNIPQESTLYKIQKTFNLPEDYFADVNPFISTTVESVKQIVKKPVELHTSNPCDEQILRVLLEGFFELSEPKKHELIGYLTLLKMREY